MPVSRYPVVLALLLLSAAAATPESLWAHPEDEFCVPGEDALDPALCDALSTLDDAAATSGEYKPILDAEGNPRGFVATAGLYVGIGVRHILPAGLDHILFVLALFLSSPRLRALVIQISTFTVAHTATLGLAAAGLIAPPANVVEPLIAATIAFVAIENLFFRDMPRWRPLVVFLFGLVHGMGFAGFFGELGLPPDQFWSGLIGFNIGVEVGQLSIVVAAFFVCDWLRRHVAVLAPEQAWRRAVVIPASLAIGLTGLLWTFERLAAQ